MPVDLYRAVDHAKMVNSWMENIPDKEMPPKWMWSFDEELKEWFEEVKRNREYNSGSSADDEPEMMSNEYAAGIRD